MNYPDFQNRGITLPISDHGTLDTLHEWFMQQGKPWWKVFKGNPKKGGEAPYSENATDEDIEEAWLSLQKSLLPLLNRGEFVTVTAATMKRTAESKQGQHDKWPSRTSIMFQDQYMKALMGQQQPQYPPQWQQQQMGMYGVGNGMHGQSFDIDKIVNEKLEAALAKKELEQLRARVEELEASPTGNRMGDIAIDIVDRKFDTIWNQFFPKKAVAPGLAVAGFKKKPAAAEQEHEERYTPEEVEARSERFPKVIGGLVNYISQQGDDPLEVFEQLLETFKTNETAYQTAKSFLL